MEREKRIRHFSEAFKREKVKMLEEKKVSVLQICRAYEVSGAAVYRWIRKYSTLISAGERVVVEKESEAVKTLAMIHKVAELERIVGQKQLQIDYLERVVELGNQEVGFDLKKKFGHK